MLMAGEVESIEVVALNEGGSVARVHLHPDAIYNGMRLRRSYFSLDMGRYVIGTTFTHFTYLTWKQKRALSRTLPEIQGRASRTRSVGQRPSLAFLLAMVSP